MIALEPTTRPTFRAALESCRGGVFPESFYSFLHEYVASVNEINNPSVFSSKTNAPSSSDSASVAAGSTGVSPTGPVPTVSTATVNLANNLPGTSITTYESMLPNESDARIDRLWNDFAMLEPYMLVDNIAEEAEKRPDKITARTRTMPFQVSDFTSTTPFTFVNGVKDILPVELSIPKRTSRLQTGLLKNQRAASEGELRFRITTTATERWRLDRWSCSHCPFACLLQCPQLHDPELQVAHSGFDASFGSSSD